MQHSQMKPSTKVQIDAANQRKYEEEIRNDIAKIDALSNSYDYVQLMELHRQLDGKYQCCIDRWGHSMYGYNVHAGFLYDIMGVDELLSNLCLMRAKLQAFLQGWNSVNQLKTSPEATSSSPDINVTVNNTVTVNITFEQVRSKIENMTSLTDEQTREALEKVAEIESVVKGECSKKAKWERIKPILAWLADKSFDVAMTMLPLLMQVQ